MAAILLDFLRHLFLQMKRTRKFYLKNGKHRGLKTKAQINRMYVKFPDSQPTYPFPHNYHFRQGEYRSC